MPREDAGDTTRRRAGSRARIGIVALTGLCVLAAGIMSWPHARERRPAAANPSPSDTWAGRLVLQPCTFRTAHGTYAADCGSIDVLERFGAAAVAPEHDRLLRLPVTRVRATASEPAEPILYLGGGPGQSTMGFKPRPELLANHDVVMVGYRGVDGSVVLDCPEVVRAMRGVAGDLLGERSLAGLGDAFGRCAQRVEAEGVDLSAYTIVDVVRDLEAAREALGYERVNLLSGSYGTRVAQVYAALHPERIHRSIMVAVNPPGRFVWEPEATDRLLAELARLCADDPACAGRTPDLVRTFRDVRQAMPSRWSFVPIDPGKVAVVTFAMLFGRDTIPQVVDAYLAAERGDASGLALMSLAYDRMFPTMFVWGDLASKAMSVDHDPDRDYATELAPDDGVLGSPFARLLWSHNAWPSAPVPERLRRVEASTVETLLVSGSIDLSTPAEHAARELLPHLVNGHHVVMHELGHTDLWTLQRPAMAQLQSTFFATGRVDDTAFVHAPLTFDVSLSFPRLAKLALAAIVLLAVAVVTLVWLTFRWWRS